MVISSMAETGSTLGSSWPGVTIVASFASGASSAAGVRGSGVSGSEWDSSLSGVDVDGLSTASSTRAACGDDSSAGWRGSVST